MTRAKSDPFAYERPGIDMPRRHRLRKVEGAWYVEGTSTLEHEPKQFRGFIPIAQSKGAGGVDGMLLEDTGKRTFAGHTDLYWYRPADPALRDTISVAVLGNVKPNKALHQEVAVPRPKSTRNLRWFRGHWQQETKSGAGWKDIPYEWIDDPKAVPKSKPAARKAPPKSARKSAPKPAGDIDKTEIPPGSVERGWSSRLRSVGGKWMLEFASTDGNSPVLHVTLTPIRRLDDPEDRAYDKMPLRSKGGGVYRGETNLEAELGESKAKVDSWDVDIPKPEGVRKQLEWHSGRWSYLDPKTERWTPIYARVWHYDADKNQWSEPKALDWQRDWDVVERFEWLQQDQPSAAFVLAYAQPKGKPNVEGAKLRRAPKSKPPSRPRSAPKPTSRPKSAAPADRPAWRVTGIAVAQALNDAYTGGGLPSMDLGKADAVDVVASADGTTPDKLIERLRTEPNYAVTFLLEVVGPAKVQKALKRATGKDRDEWLALQEQIHKGHEAQRVKPASRPKSAPKPASRPKPSSKPPKAPDATELPVGIVPLAGADGWEPAEPHAGHLLFTTEPESGTLQAVLIQGAGTPFDGKPGVKFRWITGPSKDQKEDRYGRAFWRVSDKVPRVVRLRTRADAGSKPYVVTIHGDLGRGNIWKQVNVITDGSVTVLHMAPAVLGGWKLKERTDSAPEDWEGMSAAGILDFMLRRPVAVYQATDSERQYALEQLGLAQPKPSSRKPASKRPAPKSAPKPKKSPRKSPVRFSGPKVGVLPGFALAPPSVRKCIGPKAIRAVLEDANQIDPEQPLISDHDLDAISHGIAQLTDRRMVPSHAITAVFEKVLGVEDDGYFQSAFEEILADRELAEWSEDANLVRFKCPGDEGMDVVSETPPTSGNTLEAIEWSLKMADMDPFLAPKVETALRSVQTNELGEMDHDAMDESLTAALQNDETFHPKDWSHNLYEHLKESKAVVQGITKDRYSVWFLFPPASVPRTDAGFAMYFVELREKVLHADPEKLPYPGTTNRLRWLSDYEDRAQDYATASKNPEVKKSVQAALAPRIWIQDHDALKAMQAVESDEWRERQDAAGLHDPNGFHANLAAFTILKDMGSAAKGLIVSDLVPNAGLIMGDEGRAYALMPDGEIVLLGETATPEVRAEAAEYVRIL